MRLTICPLFCCKSTKNKWVYVSEAGTPLILRLSYDGVKRDTLVSKGIYDVDDIRVDTNRGYLFYIDVGSNSIGRIDLGKFENELMIDENDFAPISLEIDYLNEIVYWGDDNGTIYGMNYWGQNITTIVSEAGKPISLAIDLINNELYWTDVRNQKLLKKKLDSGAINEIPNVVINNFHMSLALLHKTK